MYVQHILELFKDCAPPLGINGNDMKTPLIMYARRIGKVRKWLIVQKTVVTFMFIVIVDIRLFLNQYDLSRSWWIHTAFKVDRNHLISSRLLWFQYKSLQNESYCSNITQETLYHRDNALLYIAYVILMWAAPIPADRWHCSLCP